LIPGKGKARRQFSVGGPNQLSICIMISFLARSKVAKSGRQRITFAMTNRTKRNTSGKMIEPTINPIATDRECAIQTP
jgi:hypothetical protein